MIFPTHKTDYHVFVEYYKYKNIIYEIQFLWLFIFARRNGDKLIKGIATFGAVMVGGSLIDKAIFNINDYLISDFILFLIAALAAIKVYKENGE